MSELSQVNFTGSSSDSGIAGAVPMSDEELTNVAGGLQYVFKGESFSRDSWFVTFMTKRMIQDSIRQQYGQDLGATPVEVVVEGRVYLVSQIGNTVYVEAAE